ncbi:carbohydrate ABC transporter permease [Polymorphum gilvum]|uniref:Putative sugar ABC transporter permease protein n=1 Tax=Polymorphum gilvum (strain LMG 25793 / CGMCC 1.9160 / SL003B-26A1) TaxID=991905 RepID=F2J1P6_POLGS|nr:carbohydrate ABC transporter permease [Polymorphum gilvum]ADZ70847.1 Putative sugar ABC transporter permease protein [Polymorphum gilvum SL003B-26A1]
MTTDVAAHRPAAGWLAHAVMMPLAFVSIFPVWWMFVTSLRPENDIYSRLPWPSAPTLDNYAYAIQAIPVWAMLWNTLVYSALATAAQLLTAILAAYAFARWRFLFDRALFALIALTWLVPFQVVMIPNYVLVSQMGLIDTIAALVVPNLASAFAILLLVQSMRSFPSEVIEAAHMDGAGHWRILWRILVPNLRAPLAALAILLFISSWNDYFWPLLLTRSERSTVIQIGIQMFLTEEGNQWGPLMAISSLACLPVLALYAVLQRQVIDSFVKAGLK